MEHIQGLGVTFFGLFCLYVAYRGKAFWGANGVGAASMKFLASFPIRLLYFAFGLVGVFEGVRLILGFELV